MSLRRLPRDQHPGFGTEIRALLGARDVSQRELAGVIVDELDVLAEAKAAGRKHPREDSLEGQLKEIGYLRLYRQGSSIRVYFTVIAGKIWMLELDQKRQTKLSDGTAESLRNRLRWVRQRCEEKTDERV